MNRPVRQAPSYQSLFQAIPYAFVALLASAVLGAALAIGGPGLMIVGSAGVIVALISVHNLTVGLFVLVLLTYVQAFDVMERHVDIPSLGLPFVIVLLLASVLALNPGQTPATNLPRAIAAMGVYGLVLLASTVWARDAGRTLDGVLEYTKDGLVVVGALVLIINAHRLRIAVWGIIIGATVLAALSVFQYFTGTFSQDYLGFARSPVQHIIGETDLPRSAGPVGDPNFFAQMMLASFPLALERCIHERLLSLRILALISSVLIVLTVIFTFSRGGFFSLVCLVALLLVTHRRRLLPLVAAVTLVGTIALVVVPDAYTARLGSIPRVLVSATKGDADDPAVRGRGSEMRIALLMIRDHPLIGVGYLNYAALYQDYNRQLGTDRRSEERSAHSLFLQVAAETGVVGLITWGAVMLLAARSLAEVRRHRSLGTEDSANLAGGLQLAMCSWILTSLFLHSAYPRVFWLFVGVALSSSQAVLNGTDSPSTTPGALPVPDPYWGRKLAATAGPTTVA